MKTRGRLLADVRLDAFEHFLIHFDVLDLRSAPAWPFPEFRRQVIARCRSALLVTLGGVTGEAAPIAAEALRLLHAGRDKEAMAVLEELLARGPAEEETA